MAEEAKKIYTRSEVFESWEAKSTTGRNFRHTVRCRGGEIYGYFHGSDLKKDQPIAPLNPGDRFTAHYSERLYNGKVYFTLEEVTDMELDAQNEVKPESGPQPFYQGPSLDNPLQLRIKATELAGIIMTRLDLKGKSGTTCVTALLLMSKMIQTYLEIGDIPELEDTDYKDEPQEEPESPPERETAPDEDQGSDPEGDYPPEEEEEVAEEKPSANRRRTASK